MWAVMYQTACNLKRVDHGAVVKMGCISIKSTGNELEVRGELRESIHACTLSDVPQCHSVGGQMERSLARSLVHNDNRQNITQRVRTVQEGVTKHGHVLDFDSVQ